MCVIRYQMKFKKNVCLIQISSEAYAPSYPVCNMGTFAGSKAAESMRLNIPLI